MIVLDDCGCGEFIRQAGAGYLVTYNDVASLKGLILRVVTGAPEAKEMVEQGRRFVRENLRWDMVAAQMHRLYQQVKVSNGS